MQESSQIINAAIKMEKDGIDFYKKSADKVSHPFGKEMFLSFMKDEERHLNTLKEILTDLDFSDFEKYFDKTPQEEIKTVFNQIKDEMKKEVTAGPDELEILEIGMKMEDKSVGFYQNWLEETSIKKANKKAKKLLERLVLEEKEHYKILENTYSFLKDSGKWFLWEEKALIDGG